MSGGGLWNAVDPLNIAGHSSGNPLANFTQGQLDPLNIAGNNFWQKASDPLGIFPSSSQASSTSNAPPMGINTTTYNPMLPGSFSNPAYGAPSMSGYGFGYYGGQAPTPQGGYYNQMAQMMAGPSYAPPGMSWGTQPGALNSPAQGAKGSVPYGSLLQAMNQPGAPIGHPSNTPIQPQMPPSLGAPVSGGLAPQMISPHVSSPPRRRVGSFPSTHRK